LQRAGALSRLITDVWIDPAGITSRLYPQRLRERFHGQLSGADVTAFNTSAIAFEARQYVEGRRGWDQMIRRNDWFQERALGVLTALAKQHPARRFRVFSFSYTARKVFEFARSQQWSTVLGQIDPGPPEEHIVAQLQQRHPLLAGEWQPAPRRYWDAWQQECRLADVVIVNSAWSRQALIEAMVPAHKIRVVPLAYEAPAAAAAFERTYPETFSTDRPLKVLFLGQVCLRKGMAPILDAMAQLRDEPVQFSVVGPRQMNVPAERLADSNARWVGSVPRGAAEQYYRDADVFLLPTFSDGFGLTQLEAQAWQVPVIASRFCGDVVRHQVNGLLLPDVTADSITEAIRSLLREPARLAAMSRNARVGSDFSLEHLGGRLLEATTE
jgi:glycosyltransferase involved in cell wall biosynthesis